jgi:transposase-like protein
MNLAQVTKLNEEEAREYLEKLRWPNGAYCPRCGCMDVTKLAGKSTRPGVYKCKAKECRKPFTVTVGTIFERSHVKLREWVIAAHMITASKKGVSAHQVHRMLGVTYKTAWFMCHRLRHAMAAGSFDTKLQGVVEVDETYVGGKVRASNSRGKQGPAPGKRKPAVVALVERDGTVRTMAPERVTAKTLAHFIEENVDKDATLMSDDYKLYRKVGRKFARHGVIRHDMKVYAKGDLYTNTVEGFFSLIKRGIYGTFHHVSRKHLHRYASEFEFRYNRRETTDGERRDSMLGAIEGKRLTYR